MFDSVHRFHKSRRGLAIFWLVEAAIGYGFGSLAIDRGNLWWYILTLIFLVGSLRNFFRFLGTFAHGKN